MSRMRLETKRIELSTTPQPIEKNGVTIRYRFFAANESDSPRTLTFLVAGAPVNFALMPRQIRRIGGQAGWVLPADVPIKAWASGDGVMLTIQ
jgi:hypothetical protein